MATRTSLMDFQVPRIVHEEVDEQRGRFTIEPLDRGFGYTFGNSLRRVLLSSLEGAAVTSVKLEGTAHEFTTLPGIKEDVTDIILQLKNMIVRLDGESPEIEVRLNKKGPGKVTANDIEAPADLEILNPDLQIATLSDKGHLEMTMTIGRGRGYVPGELNRGPEHPIGVIPIDSIFSPVRRVSYEVEAARVGQRTDYDKLTLDVTTDGSIDPREAIGQAAEILIRQLAIFTDIERIEGFGEAAQAREAAAEAPLAHGMENFPIEELELGVRSYNCLKRVGIETIGDLVTKAKAVRPIAEKMITLGRRGDLAARRQALAFLRSQEVVHLLFAEVAPRFADRNGGYTRIVKIGPRPGDGAQMAYLEFVDHVPPAPVAPVRRAPEEAETPATAG